MRSSLFFYCLLFMLVPVASAYADQCESFQYFGATDNDLADDDTIAIQHALTSGLPICFKGTFRITSEVVMNVPTNGGAFITGFGRQTSKLILDGPSAGIKIVLATPNRVSTPQAVLRDFSLVPNGAITSNTYQAALAVTTAGGSGMTDPTFDIRNVDIRPYNPDSYAVNGLYLNNMRIGTVDNVNILGKEGAWSANSSGLVIGGDADPVEIVVRGVNVYWVQTAFNLVGTWEGVSINHCAAVAVRVGVLATTTKIDRNNQLAGTYWLRVIDSHLNASEYGIYGVNIRKSVIQGNSIYLSNHTPVGPSYDSYGIRMEMTMPAGQHLSILNNQIDGVLRTNSIRTGIYLNGAATGSLGTTVDQNRMMDLHYGLRFGNNVRNVLRGVNATDAVQLPFLSSAASGANTTLAAPQPL